MKVHLSQKHPEEVIYTANMATLGKKVEVSAYNKKWFTEKQEVCMYCNKAIEYIDELVFMGTDAMLGELYAHQDCWDDMQAIAHDIEEYKSRMEPCVNQTGGSLHSGQDRSGK